MNTELPQGWLWAKMLDILDYEGGSQPPKKEFIYEPRKGYVRLVQIRDFGGKPFPTYVPDSKRLKKVTRDDLLLARYGGSSGSDSLGRICTGLEGAYNVALAKLIFPRDLLEKEYVRYLFLGPWFREKVSQNSRSCQTGFNREDVEDIEFPIAPLAEQRRIVAKLEKLLDQVDACQQRLAKVPTLLKRFRQAVLAAAFSGRLTEDWRSRHTQDSEDKEELPEGWRLLELKEVADTIDPNPSHRYPSYENGSVPILATEQMRGLSEWDVSTSKLVNLAFYAERAAAHGFRDGDIIFARKGRLGLARRPPQIPRFVFSHTIFIIRTLHDVPSDYLLWYLRQDSCVTWLLREMNSNTGVPTLGKGYMERLPVALPPLPEQREIVRRIERLFVLADRIEARFAEGRKRVDSITQAILAKAFHGELVPTEFELAKAEGRSFQSAEELLKRIKGNGQAKQTKTKRPIKE